MIGNDESILNSFAISAAFGELVRIQARECACRAKDCALKAQS
jgi:hypothetical protein